MHHHLHGTRNQAAFCCSHSDSQPDSLQAAVGAGVEDVREVRQRLVAIEAGIVKSQRQEDKRGVDLLHRLSESEVSAATGFQKEKEKTTPFGINEKPSNTLGAQALDSSLYALIPLLVLLLGLRLQRHQLYYVLLTLTLTCAESAFCRLAC